MPRLVLRDVALEYEEVGDAGAPALLLIAGLGSQLVQWDVDFCRALADRGLRVIRFDNRDAGRPTRLDGLATPDLDEAFARARRGEALGAPYRLDDMADRLEIVPGMGHDLPSDAWPRLVDAISAVAGCT